MIIIIGTCGGFISWRDIQNGNRGTRKGEGNYFVWNAEGGFSVVIVVVGKWRVVIHIDLSYSLFMLEFVGWKRLKRIDVPIEG